jgi:hypothetical protein
MDLHLSPSSQWRWPAVTALAATAGIHIALVPAHLREAPYAGALFISLSAAALAIAILLVACNHRLVWLGAGALSLTALLTYVGSRSVGLPSLADDVGDWLNPPGVAAVLVETAAALICWHELTHGSRSATRSALLEIATESS